MDKRATHERATDKSDKADGKRTIRHEPMPVLDQRFTADSLAGLRSAVVAHATALVDKDTAEETVVVAYELATNVVRHGGGLGRLRLWATDGLLCCEISDNGPGFRDPALAGTSMPAPNAQGGRGLWIARQMSDLTIITTTAGSTITAAIPRR